MKRNLLQRHFLIKLIRCLFIICVNVYNFYYCCYSKTSSSAVQKRHSKVYGNPIAPPSIQYLLGKNNFILSEAYSGRGLWWLSPLLLINISLVLAKGREAPLKPGFLYSFWFFSSSH